jgi:hypothetical protein
MAKIKVIKIFGNFSQEIKDALVGLIFPLSLRGPDEKSNYASSYFVDKDDFLRIVAETSPQVAAWFARDLSPKSVCWLGFSQNEAILE